MKKVESLEGEERGLSFPERIIGPQVEHFQSQTKWNEWICWVAASIVQLPWQQGQVSHWFVFHDPPTAMGVCWIASNCVHFICLAAQRISFILKLQNAWQRIDSRRANIRWWAVRWRFRFLFLLLPLLCCFRICFVSRKLSLSSVTSHYNHLPRFSSIQWRNELDSFPQVKCRVKCESIKLFSW